MLDVRCSFVFGHRAILPMRNDNIPFGVGYLDAVLVKRIFDLVRHLGNGVHPFSGVLDPDPYLEIDG